MPGWGWFVILFAVMWALQYVLTYFQLRHYVIRMRALSSLGQVGTGVVKNGWGPGAVVILAVDPSGNVVAAEQMRGVSVFARFRPLPGVPGRHVVELTQARGLPRNGMGARALVAAARNLVQALPGKEGDYSRAERSPNQHGSSGEARSN